MKEFQKYIDQNTNIISCFYYGSRVYGSHKEDSDFDFIVVVNEKEDIIYNGCDITVYTKEEFQEKIQQHEISILECLFLPPEKIIKNEQNWNFQKDLGVLRKSISEKSSNSWVKCKKKFLVEKDYNPYIGKKSAWHSLRILDFGRQIAIHNKIIDYSSMNQYFEPIMNCNSWEEIEQKFKKFYNQKATEFKLVAPKTVENNNNKPKI
jgi:predicted nucleotidyltransferase